MIETYRGVVNHDQIDNIGHMNVMWYVAKFTDATWHFLSLVGLTQDYYRSSGNRMVAAEQNIKYKKEALSGDLLVIKSKLLEVNEKSLRFVHVMFNAETNEELACFECTGFHFDMEKRRSCPFPDEIYEKGKDLMGNADDVSNG